MERDSAPDAGLAACLRQGDWPRVAAYFAATVPRTATEHAARALLLTHQGAPAAQVLADWRQAVSLQPDHLLHAVNLAQALLDAGEPQAAMELALQLVGREPQSYPVLEKLALAWAALGRWDDAQPIAAQACKLAQSQGMLLSTRTRGIWADLACSWWQPLRLGRLSLRLPVVADQPFLARCFSDAAFMRRYHRFQAADPQALQSFVWRAQRPPREARRRDWLITGPQGQALGLAALVDLDFDNGRGELLVGLPESVGIAHAGLQASLAVMEFAFGPLGLTKLVSFVYGDNPKAQANTLHLGFAAEGLLRAHVQTPEGRLDLYVNGLLRQEYRHNTLLQRALRRWQPKSAPHLNP